MRSRTAFALLAASTLALSACGGDSNSGDSGGGGGGDGLGLVTPGTLTVCADVPFPPFAFEEDGEYTGFDMELTEAIADGMGLEHQIKDIGAAAMTITEEREKNLDFSDPYYDSLQSLLVPSDDEFTLEEAKGKAIAVKQGTTGADYAQENSPEGTKVQAYPSNTELYPALKSGTVDAVMMDLPSNLEHREDGKYTVSEKYDTGEQYGMPVKEEGSEKLLEGVNEQLATMKEDGSYDELYDTYFSE